ncbi:hypothetical protein [Halococcus hamelinensis]|uniref:Uncharacterized protein n=1 Tax=Halococcus hamelinensis 100A6 TaxID=1132509 RepID=M0LWS4_9EURY|nr:hypothetical protein [Halococcus hamelinensis]EMA36824.1 hypothetical protein C447_13704 [Halococcus hamelinensis 100A6]
MSARSRSSSTEPDLFDTRDRLEKALQKSEEDTESSDGSGETGIVADAAEAVDLLERAAPGISALQGWLQGETSLDDSKQEIDDLRIVVEKATDLLDTIDVAALPDAIDSDELPSAIEGKAIPKALASGKLTDPVDVGRLTELVDYGKLLQAIDLRALMKEQSELSDVLSHNIDQAESDPEAEDQNSGSGLSLQDGLQTVYKKADEGIDSFGEDSAVGEGSSSKPTAFSTVPSTRPDIRGTLRFSTVPSR